MLGITVDKSAEAECREAWLANSGRLPGRLGFGIVELGRRFFYDGELWEIAGIYRPAGRYRIVCRHVETGALRRYSKTLVRACAPKVDRVTS